MSEESIKTPSTSNNSLTPKSKFINNTKIAVEFKGSCLKQDKGTFTHRNMLNFFLFGLDKYGYNGWGVDLVLDFSLSNELGKNDITFGVDNSLSVHTDKKKRYPCSW